MATLVELDALEVTAIIDNELDPISVSPNPAIIQTGGLRDIALRSQPPTDGRGGTTCEVNMQNICCGAHGLSLLITGIKDGQRRTLLFDTGPEEMAWERNASRLKADIGRVEVIALSHWHCDHSGGMLKAIPMIHADRQARGYDLPPLTVDLHPDRPQFRGFAAPEQPVVSLQADPTFEAIESVGGRISKENQAHTVLDGMFLMSGEIPRVTTYETGIKYGVRFDLATQAWTPDELLRDERLLVCRLKDKGLVVFTGCAHAGVVNSARHAMELGDGVPLYAVYGGFHLADALPDRIEQAVNDLHTLGPKLLLPGHCTGWRAKFALQSRMPGQIVPAFVGSTYVL